MTSLTSEKHVSGAPRVYRGQNDAGPVVQWLNLNAKSEAARRVAILIADLAALCGSARPLMLRAPVGRGLISDPATWPVVGCFGNTWDFDAQRRAQKALSRYSFRPYIFGSKRKGSGFQVEMLPSGLFDPWIPSVFASKSARPRQWITVADAEGKGREQESWTILHVIRLAGDGLIARIRRCSCGDWFFAQHCRRQWCSTKCRLRDYKSTPEWKEKRNRYMREYYRDNYSQFGKVAKRGK